MKSAYHTETTIGEGGTLNLEDLPFRPGEAVEVIVLSRRRAARGEFPLRGTVTRYDRPTDPVAESDWEAVE